MKGALLVAGLVAGALFAACGDPVHEAEVAALGPEASNVAPGPMHRPGQPCLVCHGGQGPGGLTFVTAGTVYTAEFAPGVSTYPALVSGTVHLVDANGRGFDAKTNTVGNFYVTTDQWSPTFPLGAKSSDAGLPASGCLPITVDASAYAGEIGVAGPADGGCQSVPTPMSTSIDRGGVYASCAYCHFDPPGPTSPGHVFQQ